MERKAKFRTGVFLVLILCLLGLYTAQLFKLQEPAAAGEVQTVESDTLYTTVQAARGNILDRNGNVLVTNRASYNIQIINYVLFNSSDPNGSLLRLAELCSELGVDHVDHLPVSRERPYTYTLEEQSESWQSRFRLFLAQYGWDPDMSPQTLIREMKSAFGIPDSWTEEQARMVLGLRYELALRNIDGTSLESYILLSDVSTETLAAVMELSIPGLTVQTTTVREYNTTYAAHILGRVADMDPDEYQDIYQALDYPMNAKVGKDGVERAFEEYLHGTDGQKVSTVSRDGEVLDEYWSTEPEAGDNVVLTIDIALQGAAEEALEDVILDLRENGLSSSSSDSQGRGMDAEGGALVAIEVKTGDVLACASYPTFNLSTYVEDFPTLSQDVYRPYYNRALTAPYAPGSTFKMVTAIAAIDSEGIGRFYELEDKGKYTYFDTYQPECLIYTNTGTTHGVINMMEALEVSCNYYFYEVGPPDRHHRHRHRGQESGPGRAHGHRTLRGHRLPGQRRDQGAGLQKRSGPVGMVRRRYHRRRHRPVGKPLHPHPAGLLHGGPGQRRLRYRATFLERIVSSDYQTLILQNEPERISDYHFSDEAMKCVEEGMRLAASGDRGTATAYLGDYDIAVCAKTGTAEHGSSGSANGVFVCYAPADDPQIAIAVYVEKGGQGGNLAKAAIAVMDEYFKTAQTDQLSGENAVG